MGFSLIPRNDAYFDDFDAIMLIVRDMARELREAVDSASLGDELSKRLKQMEREADKVVRRVLSRLDTSFVTPIEREDIHLLIISIDDVADVLAGAASRIEVFGIIEPNDDLRRLAEGLDEMMEHLRAAVGELRALQPAKVREAISHVDRIEDEIDEDYRAALRRLFARRPEAYDLVRWKEVYDLLENASDDARDVARTIGHVLVRHS